MAGQFDKFVKILGTGSRPDRFKGAPGNPDIVAPLPTVKGSDTDTNGDGKDTNITQAAVNVAKGRKADLESRDVDINRKNYRDRPARKLLINNLKSTTMRLNESTGKAYDTEEARPTPSGRVMPTRKANPKYLAADVQRQNEDLQSFTEADRKRNQGGDKDSTGETAFNAGERAKGSSLRSVNGVTYNLEDYKKSLPGTKLNSVPAPYDISEFEPKADKTSTSTATSSSSTPSAPLKEPVFTKVDKIKARKGGKVYGDKNIDNIERESAGPTAVDYGATLSEANKKTTIYNPNGSLKPEYDNPNNIHSTTMHEVNGKVVEGGVHQAPYTKPTVNKPGHVIPASAIDTFSNQPGDKAQAEAENKRLRENRTVSTHTTVLDPNKFPSRPARGQTPERAAVLGAIREKRSAELASQGKEMTTVHPAVMDTAKRLGRTDRYNLDEDYMNSTSFLSHEAIQKATVAHALGVQNTLGDPDNDHLHRYLGGKPLEAKSRLAAAYKVVDRNLRGNPEKVVGEFALLRGMVHAGSSPQQTLRAVRGGKSNDVVVNGQNVQLSEGSSENRKKIASTTSNITAQAEAAPKIARGSIAATPNAPLAGTGRVAVRSIGQKPEEAKIREFSPQERRNIATKVPTTDDSKSKLGPIEKEVESDTSTITERLKKGKRPEDVADEA